MVPPTDTTPGVRADRQHPLAEMYAARALDSVVDLVYAVSHDLFNRPARYQALPDKVTDLLANMRGSTGRDVEWPSAPQRNVVSSRAFARFSFMFAGLRRAAIALTERGGTGPGQDVLGRSFADQVESVRSVAQDLEGPTMNLAARQTSSMLERAAAVLATPEFANVFGVRPVPSGREPGEGLYAPEAARLCQEISYRLLGHHLSEESRVVLISQRKLVVLQRVARHGAMTIGGALEGADGKDGDRALAVVDSAYRWGRSLQDLIPEIDIARAWTDPDYMSRLQPVERDMIPHPAGDVDLSDTPLWAHRFVVGGDTFTVDGEVCCSSGDLCNGGDGNGGDMTPYHNADGSDTLDCTTLDSV